MDNHRNHIETNFTDASLALLLERSAESDGERLWEEYCTSECRMPPGLDNQCRQKICKTIRKSRVYSNTAQLLKRTGQLAASLAIVLFLVVSLITSVEAFRIPVLNFILNHAPRATAILFQNSSAPSQAPLEELCGIVKLFVPEGYTLAVEHIYRDEYTDPPTVTSLFLAFQNPDDDLLTIHITPAEGTRSVDTENAAVTQLILEGQKAILIEKFPEFQMLWINDTQKLLYHITAGSMNKTDFLNYVTLLAKETKNSNSGLIE